MLTAGVSEIVPCAKCRRCGEGASFPSFAMRCAWTEAHQAVCGQGVESVSYFVRVENGSTAL
jgi:hypothetical protein